MKRVRFQAAAELKGFTKPGESIEDAVARITLAAEMEANKLGDVRIHLTPTEFKVVKADFQDAEVRAFGDVRIHLTPLPQQCQAETVADALAREIVLAWVNAASAPAERVRRKTVAFCALYGNRAAMRELKDSITQGDSNGSSRR